MPKLDFIQGARGIAALAIVLWHASRYLGPLGTGMGGALFHPAVTMGVDLFFILSGYLMVVTTRGNDGSVAYAWRFMARRLTRIWPTYAVALLATVILFRRETWGFEALRLLARALVFLPLGPDGTGNVAPLFGVPPLPVGWTLAYEMYFYLFFAVSLLFGRLQWLALAVWGAATLVVLPYATAGRFTVSYALIPEYRPPYVSYLDLMSNPIVYQFLAGALIGALYVSPLRVGNAWHARLLLLASAAFVAWQYGAHAFLWHGPLGAGVSLIPGMAGLCMASKTVRVPCPAWLARLGGVSYSLYLWHPIVQMGFNRAVRAAGQPDLATGLLPFVTTTLLSVAVAAVSQRYLEHALSNAIRRGLLWRGEGRGGAAGRAALIAGAGSAGFQVRGFRPIWRARKDSNFQPPDS